MILLGDRILIEPYAKKEQTAGGIFLPTTAAQKTEGVIVQLGPKVKKLKVGDHVRLFDHVGVHVDGGIIAKEDGEVDTVLQYED